MASICSFMASIVSISSLLFLTIFSISMSSSMTLSASVIEDLNNSVPPPDFNSSIMKNCKDNPSLRYCTNPLNLPEIFKFTIVASHLCNESNNPKCVESFSKIDLRNRPNIAPLYLSFDFFWKYCPLTILSIDLSNTSLKGNFPFNVLQCAQIEALDLSHNDLHGNISIQSLSPLTNLTLLNLSYNNFSESNISDAHFFERFNSSSFIHSGLLHASHWKYKINGVILFIGILVFVILLVGFLVWLCFKRPDFLPTILRKKHEFTLPMLKAATNGFSRNNIVRKSGGVDIYKGTLRDGTLVRIEIYKDNMTHEERHKFSKECKVLVQLEHTNIVRVLGWCNNRRLRAKVTEWNNGETVEMCLSSGSSLPWNHRLRILMGVIEGMCYLHNEWPEIGYNIRTSSILLSEDRRPLISRLKVENRTSSSRKIYKFGVLVLQMVVNTRAKDEFERGESDFIEWMRMRYPGNMHELIHEVIQKTANIVDQPIQAIGLGLLCTDLSRGRQPSFAQVYNMITRLYESNQGAASINQHRSHGEGRRK